MQNTGERAFCAPRVPSLPLNIASRPTASDRDSLGVPRRLLLPRSEYVSNFFDPSRLCSLLPDDRALHTGDSRPREVSSGNLLPHVAGAANRRVGRQILDIASRLAAVSDCAPPGVPKHHARAGERTSERRAEDDGRAVAYAIVQHAGQRN
eukprot:scaffold2077_cov66-Phaeocystis_antarctica.AAC.4